MYYRQRQKKKNLIKCPQCSDQPYLYSSLFERAYWPTLIIIWQQEQPCLQISKLWLGCTRTFLVQCVMHAQIDWGLGTLKADESACTVPNSVQCFDPPLESPTSLHSCCSRHKPTNNFNPFLSSLEGGSGCCGCCAALLGITVHQNTKLFPTS